MNLDYSYCQNKDTCIHRRGCKRWLGNHHKTKVKQLAKDDRAKYISDKDCLDEDDKFSLLDRFRGSDGF